jgi:hypothetical protein
MINDVEYNFSETLIACASELAVGRFSLLLNVVVICCISSLSRLVAGTGWKALYAKTELSYKCMPMFA